MVQKLDHLLTMTLDYLLGILKLLTSLNPGGNAGL